MNCAVSEKLLNAYLDDELAADKKSELEDHLIDCEQCRLKYKQLLGLNNLLAESSLPEAEIDFAEKVMAKIKTNSEVSARSTVSGGLQKIAALFVFAAGIGFGGFLGFDYQNYVDVANANGGEEIYELVQSADSTLADDYMNVMRED